MAAVGGREDGAKACTLGHCYLLFGRFEGF